MHSYLDIDIVSRGDELPVVWLGTSRDDLRSLPLPVRLVAGFQLWRVQVGALPNDWKPMRSVGAGVRELRIRIDGQYRIFYLVQRAEAVVVLHVFRKKSAKTPALDIELARRRLKAYVTQR